MAKSEVRRGSVIRALIIDDFSPVSSTNPGVQWLAAATNVFLLHFYGNWEFMETLNKQKKSMCVTAITENFANMSRRNRKEEQGKLFLTCSSGIWTGYNICRSG